MTTRSIVHKVLGCLMAATISLATFGTDRQARADYVTPDPGLPPHGGVQPAGYYSAGQHGVYQVVGVGGVVLSNIVHTNFANIQVTTVGQNEFESFNSQLNGMASINGSPATPFTLNGPVEVEAMGKAGLTTGTFDTQMLSMDMTGTVLGHAVEITLNPNASTTGQTTITDIGGGLFNIHSFFDVFTELSLDGGSFAPSTSGTTVTLAGVPEPSTWIMYVTAGLMVPASYLRWGRRRG